MKTNFSNFSCFSLLPPFSFVFNQLINFLSFKMSNLENHNPQVIRQLSKEVKNLANEQLEGIKISINESNLTDIQATIDGPGMISTAALKSQTFVNING